MKPKIITRCVHHRNKKCTRFGYTIDDCKYTGCKVALFESIAIHADPDFEPFIDELNRRLDKGV